MRQWIAIVIAAGAVAATLPFIRQNDEALVELLGKAKSAVVGAEDGPEKKGIDPPALTDLSLANIDDRRDPATAPAHGSRNAELTLDVQYQRAAIGFLRQGQVYEGSVVMTEVETGKVLVWANYNQGRPRDLASEAFAPSASVFKIVTGAALFEVGVPLNQKFPYSGGVSGITMRDLEPDERRDHYAATLPMAMGRSLNTVFARLARAKLDHEKLGSAARRLGWGTVIPFDVPIATSTIDLPEDSLEFARTAAGFWHTTLSPFHAAFVAQTIANKGEMIRSNIVERVLDKGGEVIYQRPTERQVLGRVLDERTAWAVTLMMEQTVRNGTGFRTFHDRQGRPFLPNIRVAGKTGTLNDKKTDTLFTWFVGFAPSRDPKVTISVIVANRGKWRIKGTHVACSMLRAYFADQGYEKVGYPSGYFGERRRPKDSKADAN